MIGGLVDMLILQLAFQPCDSLAEMAPSSKPAHFQAPILAEQEGWRMEGGNDGR